MTTFYICRHGETENNKKGRLSGWIDTPLTDQGIQNAHTSAAKLQAVQFDAVVASDLGRAFITAYLITKQLGYNGEIQLNRGLREVDYGELSNMYIADVSSQYSDLDTYNPTGETLAQMQDRVLLSVTQLSASHSDQTVLLVAHDGTINAIYAGYMKQDIVAIGESRTNAHDFVGTFSFGDHSITTFKEVT